MTFAFERTCGELRTVSTASERCNRGVLTYYWHLTKIVTILESGSEFNRKFRNGFRNPIADDTSSYIFSSNNEAVGFAECLILQGRNDLDRSCRTEYQKQGVRWFYYLSFSQQIENS